MPPGRFISTPRERTGEPTLISGLIRTFEADREEKQRHALEEEERRRRREQEDVQTEAAREGIEGAKQGREIARGTFQREQRGVEPQPLTPIEPLTPQARPSAAAPSVLTPQQPPSRNIFGLDEQQPLGDTLRQQAALQPREAGVGVSGRVSLAPPTDVQGRPEHVAAEGGALQPRAGAPQAQGQQEPRTPGAILQPSRDPTIVNPELGKPTFKFEQFEADLELPEGSLEQAFKENPVGTLREILASGGGAPASARRLSALRQLVQLRINSVEQRISETVLEAGEEATALDEIDALTIGLLDAAVGGRADFDLDTTLDQIDLLFPDDSKEEKAARAERIQRKMTGAREFSGQAQEFLQPKR